MIGPGYVRTMARYNAWQNSGLIELTGTLSDSEMDRHRGAFFGSILGTLNHLLWGDELWMSRFDGGAGPGGSIPESPRLTPNRAAWAKRRAETDRRILRWAETVSEADLAGDLEWYSGALGENVRRPLALCIVHAFNHQTHHRGQVHAMLTGAGLTPGATDLFIMPDAA